MINLGQARRILLEALVLPEGNDRVQFFYEKEQASRMLKPLFYKQLWEVWELDNKGKDIEGPYTKDGAGNCIPIKQGLDAKELAEILPALEAYKKHESNNIWLFGSKGEVVRKHFSFDEIPIEYHSPFIKLFDKSEMSETDIDKWQTELKKSLEKTPEPTASIFLQKGIELAKLRLAFYREHTPKNSQFIRNWQSCIMIAEGMINDKSEMEPTINGTLKNASHYFIVMWELGIIDALKKSASNLVSQRQGEILEMITGQKCDDFRKAISYPDPSEHKLFTKVALQSARKELLKFGYDPKRINEKLKSL